MINRNDVIRMALEADFCVNDNGEISTSNSYGIIRGELDRFAALVVAHEREACAKVCEVPPSFRSTLDGSSIRETIGKRIAAAIRARGNT